MSPFLILQSDLHSAIALKNLALFFFFGLLLAAKFHLSADIGKFIVGRF